MIPAAQGADPRRRRGHGRSYAIGLTHFCRQRSVRRPQRFDHLVGLR
ncbi:MAG: hypothetical protein R2911_43730 [Caldilineaceae bacterium]